jgi:hypothetical protein
MKGSIWTLQIKRDRERDRYGSCSRGAGDRQHQTERAHGPGMHTCGGAGRGRRREGVEHQTEWRWTERAHELGMHTCWGAGGEWHRAGVGRQMEGHQTEGHRTERCQTEGHQTERRTSGACVCAADGDADWS